MDVSARADVRRSRPVARAWRNTENVDDEAFAVDQPARLSPPLRVWTSTPW